MELFGEGAFGKEDLKENLRYYSFTNSVVTVLTSVDFRCFLKVLKEYSSISLLQTDGALMHIGNDGINNYILILSKPHSILWIA